MVGLLGAAAAAGEGLRAPDALADARDPAELGARYPGVTKILEAWFVNYKGPGELESRGFGSADTARAVLQAAMATYAAQAARGSR